MKPFDVTERVVDVVALLLRTRVPLTHREISQRLGWVYGGEDGDDLKKRMFDRDKETLRDWGYELDMVYLPEQNGAPSYLIKPDEFFLHDAGLTADEQLALRIAAAGTVGGVSEALDKLGGQDAVPGAARWIDPDLGLLGPLLRAVRERQTVTFTYQDGTGRETGRHVRPDGLLSQDGYWYLVCWDLDRNVRRTLRVDRIGIDLAVSGPTADDDAGLFSPDVLDPDPKLIGDGPLRTVQVAVEPDHLSRATDAVDGGTPTGNINESWPVVSVTYRNEDGLRSWLIGLGPHARVLDGDVADWFLNSIGAQR